MTRQFGLSKSKTAVRPAELTAARTMIERVRDRHDLHPDRLAADTAYGSAEMLEWLVNDQGIAPHIPIIDKSGREDGSVRQDAATACRRPFSCPRPRQNDNR